MKQFLLIAPALFLLITCGKANESIEEPTDRPQKTKVVAVDIGLSVKWANCNLGASKPESLGDYYAWGETETKKEYNYWTYIWCFGSNQSFTKYNYDSAFGNVDNKTVLEIDDDVAHEVLGGKWRMPTCSEFDELISTKDNGNYQWEWKYINGHNGWLVTYLVNNNSIYLPAAGNRHGTKIREVDTYGEYWSSSISTGSPDSAYFGDFSFYGIGRSELGRCLGLSIRPVYPK